MFTRFSAGLAGVIFMFALTGAANAAPFSSPIETNATGDTLVQMVHGCHRDVQYGVAGPHYHAGPGCRRIAAGGGRSYDRGYGRDYGGYGRGYGGYGPRRHGYCRDVRTCRYVGPIKRCRTKTVCN